MRVLILIPRMGGGGAERVVSTVANSLCALPGYQIKIATLVSNESFYSLDDRIEFESADYQVNRKNKYTRLMSLASNFLHAIHYTKRKIDEFKPDVVFSLLEEMDIVTYFAKHGRKGTYICSERNDPTKRNHLLQKVLNHIYKKSDMLVCQTRTVSEYYSMVPDERKTVIPNPIDLDKLPPKKEEADPPYIAAVGRLVPQKNFGLLIESFQKIAAEFPEIHLTIYGEGTDRPKLEKKIEEGGLENRIALPGAVKNVSEKICSAAVFVMSSDYEGFPNALVEAIAMGVPVISTDFSTGAARELISDTVGLTVPCGDSEKLADAMRRLLSDKEQRKKIRARGSEAVQQLDTSKVVKAWCDLFEIQRSK